MKARKVLVVTLDYNKLEEDSLATLKKMLYNIQESNQQIESLFLEENRLKNTVNVTFTILCKENKEAQELAENIIEIIYIPGVKFNDDLHIVETIQKENWFQTLTVKKGIILATIGSIIMILLSLLIVLVIEPALDNRDAKTHLEQIEQQRGPITPINTKATVYQGQKIENANVNQKGLGNGQTVTTPASYIFTNGKQGQKKTVEVFIDFTNQRSRDFLIMNRENLRSLVENGFIELRILPVPTGKSYTIYASEALAEAFVLYPEKSWEFMYELAILYTNSDTSSIETIIDSITELAHSMGMEDITTETLKNGTFASWIISIGNDKRLQTGYYPPLVYIDNKLVETENLNDTENLRNLIVKK